MSPMHSDESDFPGIFYEYINVYPIKTHRYEKYDSFMQHVLWRRPVTVVVGDNQGCENIILDLPSLSNFSEDE